MGDDPKRFRQKLERIATATTKKTIVNSQKWLGDSKNVPRQTGRMRSGWFATEGTNSTSVPADDADAARTDAEILKIKAKTPYYLTNSLPYAPAVALGEQLPPSWNEEQRVVSASSINWFKNFRTTTLPELQALAFDEASREEGRRQ